MNNLATIINFCTHDLRFLDRCIRGVRPFSKQIIIPVCDHFFDGTPEDLSLLKKIYAKYPDVEFLQFAFSKEQVYGTPSHIPMGSPGFAQHWHNSARLIGTYFLQEEIEWVLFVDVDEIFAREIPALEFDAVRFATYWYFGSATRCATVYPMGPLLVRRKKLSHDSLLDEDERMGLFHQIAGNKKEDYLVEGKPIVHHYSWVRTEEELHQKVTRWGHHWERNWKKLIEEGEGNDFARGYEYIDVKPFWDPLREEIDLPNAHLQKNVRYVTHEMIARMELESMLRG